MKMKKTMAVALGASLLLSVATPISAALDLAVTNDAPPSSVAEAAKAVLYGKMEVTEIAMEAGVPSYLLVKSLPEASSPNILSNIRLNISEQTLCIDSKTGLASQIADIKKGDVIYASHASAMTRSIPPQSAAYALIVNPPETGSVARHLVAEKVTQNENGSVSILTDSAGLILTLAKDATITSYQSAETLTSADITEGMSFFAWYDVVALSLPAQAQTEKLVLAPAVGDTARVKEDALKPLQPGETSPYRFGVEATVREVTLDGSKVKSYTLQPTDGKIPALIATVDDSTPVLDNKTGQPLRTALEVGANVYVYYDDSPAASGVAKVAAELILSNLEKGSAVARLLTVERSEQSVDGSVRLLGENKSLWVTIGKDTPISVLNGAEKVENTTLRTGTQLLVWCDGIAESMPAQTSAKKAIVLPSAARSFTILIGGDMAVAKGVVENGVAMVPLRKVAEVLGYTVTWNDATRSAHLTNGKRQTTVTLGEDLYFYSTAIPEMVGMSKPMPLGAPAYLENDTTFVPVELFALLGGLPTLTGNVLHL